MDPGKIVKATGNGGANGSGVPEGHYSLAYSYPQLPQIYGALDQEQPGLRDYWHVLLKRRWVVAAAFTVIVLLTLFETFRTKPLYQAIGSVAVYRDGAQMLDFKQPTTLDTDDWDYTVALETQVRVMQSDALALKVARDLGLDKKLAGTSARAEENGGTVALTGAQPLTASQESNLISQVRGNVQIATLPNTRMIELRYWSPDPEFAAKALNVFMDDYIQENIRAKYESSVQASQFLSRQLNDLQLKVQTSQEKLVKYEKENDILGLDEKQNIITEKLNDLNKSLTEATADRIQKEATFRQTSSNAPEMLGQMSTNSLIEQLRGKEADLKTQYAQVSTQFGPEYPKVAEIANELKQVQASIEAENKRLGGRFGGEYRSALQREQLLREALEKQKAEANRLNERAIQYSLLKRDLETNQQLYESIQQRMKEAGVSAALKSSNIRVVDPARVPTAPSKPNIPRNLLLGVLFGIIAGVGLAFGVEVMDNTVRTPEQVQTISALPALGIVPMSVPLNGNGHGAKLLKAAERSKVEIISHSHPKSEIAESYRALRTSILLSSLGAPPQVILITSALPQEGKTTTAVNSAIVLAQQGGRVLLVDADLRRPSIHASLGLRTKGGLSTLLTGSNRLEQVMVQSPQVNRLFVLPAGPTPPQPAELLSSQLMREFLKRWREQFDHIVIDTPPALSVTDAVALSVSADSVILVIRSGSTSKEALRRARDLLMRVNAKVTGVVVNAADLRAPDLHHYYYSGGNYASHYYDDSTTQKNR